MDRPTKPSGRHAVRLRWDEIITRISFRFNFLAIRDGIFQIEVNDDRGRQTKGLPFQSKKAWRSTDSKLLGQARQMLETAGDGIVIDFRPDRFSACRAEDVVHNQANRKLIDRAGRTRPLGQLLGDDFLDCRIGRPGLFYDPITERWQGDMVRAPDVEHVITTRV